MPKALIRVHVTVSQIDVGFNKIQIGCIYKFLILCLVFSNRPYNCIIYLFLFHIKV